MQRTYTVSMRNLLLLLHSMLTSPVDISFESDVLQWWSDNAMTSSTVLTLAFPHSIENPGTDILESRKKIWRINIPGRNVLDVKALLYTNILYDYVCQKVLNLTMFDRVMAGSSAGYFGQRSVCI